MTQQTIDNLHVDWLGNQISAGDWVLYSSKSTNVGMNLGKVEYVGPAKKPGSKRKIIQVRIVSLTTDRFWSKGKLVTLDSSNGAYKSVTKYPDSMIRFDLPVDVPHGKITPGGKIVPTEDFVCGLGSDV